MRHGKHGHRHLLDELLRQDCLNQDEYKQLNTMLAESLDGEMDIEPASEEEDEFKKMIKATTNDIIESDEKELTELLTEFKEEITEDFIDDVLQLEKIIDAFLIDDYLEGKPIVPMIDEILKTLEGSARAKSKQQR